MVNLAWPCAQPCTLALDQIDRSGLTSLGNMMPYALRYTVRLVFGRVPKAWVVFPQTPVCFWSSQTSISVSVHPTSVGEKTSIISKRFASFWKASSIILLGVSNLYKMYCLEMLSLSIYVLIPSITGLSFVFELFKALEVWNSVQKGPSQSRGTFSKLDIMKCPAG